MIKCRLGSELMDRNLGFRDRLGIGFMVRRSRFAVMMQDWGQGKWQTCVIGRDAYGTLFPDVWASLFLEV